MNAPNPDPVEAERAISANQSGLADTERVKPKAKAGREVTTVGLLLSALAVCGFISSAIAAVVSETKLTLILASLNAGIWFAVLCLRFFAWILENRNRDA